jgi:hypothetical protein
MPQALRDKPHDLRPEADNLAFLAAFIHAFEMGTNHQQVAGSRRQAAEQGEHSSSEFAHGISLGPTL